SKLRLLTRIRAPERHEHPAPGLVQAPPRILDAPGEGELLRPAACEHLAQDRQPVAEDLLHQRGLAAVDVVQQGGQRALAEVELQRAEADALPVEIARDAAEAARRRRRRLERAGEGQAAEADRLLEQRG